MSSPSKYCNTSPCWHIIDEILCLRLNVLYHLLGSDVVDPSEAAEMFSTISGRAFNFSTKEDIF